MTLGWLAHRNKDNHAVWHTITIPSTLPMLQKIRTIYFPV